MRNELVVKSRGLKGASDLTLLAPIKPGLVPSLEVVTYKTRVKRLMKTLNMGRSSAHEYALLRPISDAVERVRVIHSFRVMVLEPEDKILLAVTFDGTWESYIRTLWQKVGTLLDVIFCNSDGYVTAAENGFEAWCAWVRRVQVETEFFYSTPGFTGDDFYYLREAENLHQRCPANKGTDLAAARLAWNSVEQQAWNTARHLSPLALAETARQGLQSLSVLHRLTYMYVPGTPDGAVLQRAAREILMEFVRLAEQASVFQGFVQTGRLRFDEPLSWLLGNTTLRTTPPLPDVEPPYPATEVQGGILNAYTDVNHGALLLLAFDDATAAAAWLRALPVDDDRTRSAAPRPTVNLALTHEGLRLLGLGEAELALFPQEFREGMEARAGMLGDLRGNHPRRWRLPQRHGGGALVELNTVHAVLQLRGSATPDTIGDDIFADGHPLRDTAERWARQAPGVRLLAVQTMQRQRRNGRIVEHFGFVDDDSSTAPPTSPQQRGVLYDRQLRLGEILCGHDNEGDFAADLDPAPLSWLHNGSFLVVRKLRQDVAALNRAVEAASTRSLPRKTVLAKMMGRTLDGEPLAAPGRTNGDFDYGDDPDGSRCPFQAHVRRANPRLGADSETPLPRGGRQPRIVRRGMGYGAPAAAGMLDDDGVDRGLVFMAYNARISEQFEVIQRWLAGGNSSGIFSGASDPLLGVPEDGRTRVFRFEHDSSVHRVTLDGSSTPMADPKPFVRLEWGMYLFVPALPVIRRLAERAAAARPLPAWSAAAGERRLQALLALQREQGDAAAAQAWKTLLEDHESQDKFVAAGVWAAIREHHGGALRTPYGVLVAAHDLVVRALHAPAQQLSVRGYHERLAASIGEIYLGMDDTGPGCPYHRQSAATNQAIGAISRVQAFELARGLTAAIVQGFVSGERALAAETNQPRWELNLNAKEVFDRLLAGLCEAWFGLQPDPHSPLVMSGTRWDWQPGQPATYPGHFTAPSRYTFQPRPEPLVVRYGQTWGHALTAAMQEFVQQHLDAGLVPQHGSADAPVAAAIFAAFPGQAGQLARTMVGAIMGFVPTLDGNLKLTLNEWLREGLFWTLRQQLPATPATLAEAEACLGRALREAMQLRPSPELLWRTAVHEHRLGPLTLQPGETVVLALVSATQQSLAAGDDDLYPIFGGDRSSSTAPTHACPGYEAAIGVLLGCFTALLQVPHTLRPSPAPLAFTLEGTQDTQAVVRPRPLPPPAPGTTPKAWLIADGDSWFDDWGRDGVDAPMDLLRALRVSGWGVDELADAGDTLAQIASPEQLQAFSRRLRRMVALGRPPRAVLLSGGGNDVVGERLLTLLNPCMEGRPALNAAGRALIRKTLRGHVETAVQHYLAACDALLPPGQPPVPVLLHGYDWPVPDGRGPYGIESQRLSWLKPWLARCGYEGAAARRAARELIDALNTMLRAVARTPRFGGRVRHVDLRGTLCSDPADPAYKDDWENELHPTEAGFVKLAAVIARQLPAA